MLRTSERMTFCVILVTVAVGYFVPIARLAGIAI